MVTLIGLGLLLSALSGAEAQQAPGGLFEVAGPLTPRNRIDDLVFARWKAMGIRPPNLCSDAVFLRRAWLDAAGVLPTAEEAAEFLGSQNPNKRAALVDRLLES